MHSTALLRLEDHGVLGGGIRVNDVNLHIGAGHLGTGREHLAVVRNKLGKKTRHVQQVALTLGQRWNHKVEFLTVQHHAKAGTTSDHVFDIAQFQNHIDIVVPYRVFPRGTLGCHTGPGKATQTLQAVADGHLDAVVGLGLAAEIGRQQFTQRFICGDIGGAHGDPLGRRAAVVGQGVSPDIAHLLRFDGTQSIRHRPHDQLGKQRNATVGRNCAGHIRRGDRQVGGEGICRQHQNIS